MLGWQSAIAPPRWSAQRDRVLVGDGERSAWIGWNARPGLLCGRGAMGGHPLYWAREGDDWLIASRLEAVILALGTPLTPDDEHAASVVASLPLLDPRATPYVGVLRLLSGERRSFPTGSVVAATEEPTALHLDEMAGSDDDLADALWKAAYASVARAAAGVRVLGVLAGGGLDSSGLLAAAVEHARERGDLEVVPLALDFAAPGDDRPHLRATAEWLRVEPLRVPPEDAAPFLRSSLVVDARPSLEATLPLLVAAAVAGKRRGVDTIISGFLGDLILDAPSGATVARMRAGGLLDCACAVADSARLRDPWRTAPHALVWSTVVAPLLRPLFPRRFVQERRRRAYGAIFPWAGPSLRSFLGRQAERPPTVPALATAEQRFASLSANRQLLEQVDTRVQVEILSGVRFSEPWMDPTFCRTIARIPGWRLAARGRERGLFRHALRGHLPDSVRLRPDKATMEPALDRMLAAAGGESSFAGLLDAPRLVQRGYVDAGKLARVTSAFFSRGPSDNGGDTWTTLWSVAAAEAFLESAELRRA